MTKRSDLKDGNSEKVFPEDFAYPQQGKEDKGLNHPALIQTLAGFVEQITEVFG